MESFLTPSNIMFVLGIIGIIFTVYNYFRNPQIKSDKIDALLSLKFDMLEKSFTNLKDNHLHTLEVKLDKHIQENQLKAIEDAKWQSRIETLLGALTKN